MQKKTLIQLSLLFFIFIISIIFYKIFFNDTIKNSINKNLSYEKNDIDQKKSVNTMKDVTYGAKDLDGNTFELKSEFAKIDSNEPDIIIMKNVDALIFLKNSELIKISSVNASYNSFNLTTAFYENVLITYKDHTLISNNFDLFFDKKIGTASNDVVYKSLDTTIQADKIDIDLITKNSKIYMLNKSNKVKIKNLN